MKMKNVVMLLLGCFAIAPGTWAQKKPAYVVLQGQIKGKTQQILLEDMSAFQYLLPVNPDHIIALDSAGRFTARIPLQRPGYYRLVRNILYLTPGDNLQMVIDWVYPEKSEITGKGMEANNYLRYTPFPKAGSNAGAGCRETPEATITSLTAMRAARDSTLQQLQQVSATFKRLEAARNQADLIHSLKSGSFYCINKLKLKREEAQPFLQAYNKAIAPVIEQYSKNFLDTSFMQLVVYRDIAEDLLAFNRNPAQAGAIRDWYKATAIIGDMKEQADKQAIAIFSRRIDSLQTPAYKKALQLMLQKQMSFVNGDKAVDFTAVDANGKQVKLSDLKGKLIYVDFWATWCMPCMQEMPSLKKLKEQFADNSNVVFLSVSIDDDKAMWQSSLVKNNFNGHQWLINRNALQAYKVTSIPRMLLIDQDFRMINLNATRPSDPGTAQQIQSLVQHKP